MVVTASPARLLSLSRAADGGEGYRDRGSPGGCGNQDDNGRWNGCRDKIRFCCLSAEGAGKATSPYPPLISSAKKRAFFCAASGRYGCRRRPADLGARVASSPIRSRKVSPTH